MADAGLMGGIGNFLDSYVNSSKAERAYQDQKAQLAIANAQKDREMAEKEAADISQFGSGGREYQAEQAAIAARASSPQNLAHPQQQPTSPASGDNQDSSGNFQGPSSDDWANAMGAGVLNKPPGSGFMAQQSPLSTVPSVTAQANTGVQPPQPQGQNGMPKHVEPFAMQMLRAQKDADYKKAVDDKALTVNAEGGHADEITGPDGRPMINPKTLDLGPQKKAELKNAEFNNRSALGALTGQYEGEKAVAAARDISVPVGQAFNAFKEGGPLSDETMASTLAQMEGEKSGDPQKAVASGSASQAIKDYLSQKASGGVTQQTRQNMIREIQSNMESRATAMNSLNAKYMAKAKAAGIDPTNIISNPDVAQTLNMGRKLVSSFGPAPQPTGMGGMMMGLLNGGGNKSAPAQPHAPGSTVYVKGMPYIVGKDGDSLVPQK